jgi:gas vesicle protein
MKSGQAILGLLAGVAIGVTLGILFAPEKGSSTRDKISKKGEGLATDANEMLNSFLSDFVSKYESAKEGAVKMADNGMKKIENFSGTHTKTGV